MFTMTDIHLKVHKRDNFLGSDIEMCTFSMLFMQKCEGFVLKKILVDHYWGREDCSAYSETTQNEKKNLS